MGRPFNASGNSVSSEVQLPSCGRRSSEDTVALKGADVTCSSYASAPQDGILENAYHAIEGISSITGAIFDCDGTLLDSLGAWRSLETFLSHEAGVTPSAEEHELFTTFTIPEVARYFHEVYGLGKSNEGVSNLIKEYMLDYYRNKAALLPGVGQFLESCARANIAMSVASSTMSDCLEAGLSGAGIRQFFSHVLSVEDMGTTKREPLIFNRACELMGTEQKSTWGFEDSLYAMNTLRMANYPVLGIYDEGGEPSQTDVQTVATISVASFEEVAVLPTGYLAFTR